MHIEQMVQSIKGRGGAHGWMEGSVEQMVQSIKGKGAPMSWKTHKSSAKKRFSKSWHKGTCVKTKEKAPALKRRKKYGQARKNKAKREKTNEKAPALKRGQARKKGSVSQKLKAPALKRRKKTK